MSLKINITDIDHIAIGQYCILQQKSFAQLFAYSQIDSAYLDPAFFKWKYNTPSGKARIAIAEENDEIIASVAMFPLQLIENGRLFKAWHFAEAATLPKARGRGLFKTCMQMLMNSLVNDEMIYVFPNKASLHATEKMGFQKLAHIPFYGKLVFRISTSNETEVPSNCNFSVNQDVYARALAINNKVMIYRDAAYMNWRYKSHPHASYYSYSAVQDYEVTGNIVIRSVKFKQQKFLLLMEFHSLSRVAEKEMLKFLQKVSSAEKCSFAGLFSSIHPQPNLLTTGMIKLPSFILPKQQILMRYKLKSEDLGDSDWFVQTGDWDAF